MTSKQTSSSNEEIYAWSKSHASLRKWRLSSFKSIGGAVEVELAPLTVLVGANSAGKSSLIQSILLMAQNAVSAFREVTPQLRGNLELNSYLVQLGSMKETVCDINAKKNKKFSIELGGSWFLGDRPLTYFDSKSVKDRTRVRRESISPRGEGGILLEWETEFIPQQNDKDSGIAVVHESSASISLDGSKVQQIRARARRPLSGFEVAQSKYEKFSFEHSSSLSSSKDPIHDDSNSTEPESSLRYSEENDAVCFRSGLPVSGLQLVNILDYIFSHQLQVFYQVSFGDSKYENSLFSPEGTINEEKAYATKDQAADAFLEELADRARAILQQDQVADDLNMSVLSNRIEQIPLLSPSRIPFDFLRKSQESDKQDNSIEEIDDFFSLVKSKLAGRYANAEWTEKEVLCSSDGRRTRDPIYKNSKTASAIELWNRYLSESVLYLGPLRAAPKSTYGLGSGTVNSNIPLGESGEFLAKTLFNERILKRYPILENGELRPRRTTLEEAVSFWYQELCITPEIQDSIAVQAPGRQGYQLNIGQRTLANVGFGVSQILPVIALCLMAPPGSLVLLEQPELHLNPGMQQKLADFLLHMVKTGRQIIVETHSEYLITRLRRNAATNSEDHKYFGIIFAEKDQETGTHYRPVNVNDSGDLSEWPQGFFDQVADDLRVLMRKASERKNRQEQ